MKRLRLWLSWHFGWLPRERVEMAWQRIQSLEVQNGRMAAALLSQQNQMDDLRRILTARKVEEKPAPKIAKNWREVQNFVGEEIDAAR